jgi:hypothetical protein
MGIKLKRAEKNLGVEMLVANLGDYGCELDYAEIGAWVRKRSAICGNKLTDLTIVTGTLSPDRYTAEFGRTREHLASSLDSILVVCGPDIAGGHINEFAKWLAEFDQPSPRFTIVPSRPPVHCVACFKACLVAVPHALGKRPHRYFELTFTGCDR